MKRMICLIAVFALLFGMSFAASAEEKKLTIPVIYLDVSINFAKPLKAGAMAAGKEFGVNAIFDGPVNFNVDQQVSIIEGYITKKVDGLVIAPLSADVIDPIIAKARKAGIPVVTFNSDSPNAERMAFYGQDLVQSGLVQAGVLVEYMGEKGKVLITTVDAAAPWSKMREQGVREGLAKYPGIEIIGTINAKGDEQASYAALENAIQANPDCTGIASLDAITTPGVGRAILRYDLKGKVKQVGHDLMPETLDNIDAGATNATLSQNPYMQGYLPVKALVEYFRDGKPLESVDTGILRVDEKNIDEFMKRLDAKDETLG